MSSNFLSIVHADPMFVVAVIACPGCRLSFTWQIGLSNHLRTFAACNFAHKQQTLGVEAITRPVRVRTRRTVDFKCRVLDALINFERDGLAFPQKMVALRFQGVYVCFDAIAFFV